MFKIGDFSRLSQVSVKALRYYDRLGLLTPAHIDPYTAYRYYTADQLPRLNRILALKDLGLSLEEIGTILASELSPEQLGTLLRQKREEIARQLAEEQARLARVDARLKQIADENDEQDSDVVIKPVAAQDMIGIRAVVADYASIAPLFEVIWQRITMHTSISTPQGPFVTIYYDDGYQEQDVDVLCAVTPPRAIPDSERVKAITLPAAPQMACAIYRGPYEKVSQGYAAILRWIDANRYTICGPNRMVYLHGPGSTSNPDEYISEIQFPVAPVTED